MNRTSAFLVVASIPATFGTCTKAADHQPYLPLAEMTVTASGPDAHDLEKGISDFANKEGLTIEAGNFPKKSRTVLNETVRFRGDTFFHVGDFERPGEFEIVAYSHETQAVWRPAWDRLARSLSAKFRVIPNPLP
jgi:hypothetical protein